MATAKISSKKDGSKFVRLDLTGAEAEYLRTILGSVYPAYSPGYHAEPYRALEDLLSTHRQFLKSRRVPSEDVAVCTPHVARALTAGDERPTGYIAGHMTTAGYEVTGY